MGQALTETARESEGSGAETAPGGAAAGRGDTWDVTSEGADKAGSGGRHGAKQRVRERVAGRRENPDGKSSGVGSR